MAAFVFGGVVAIAVIVVVVVVGLFGRRPSQKKHHPESLQVFEVTAWHTGGHKMWAGRRGETSGLKNLMAGEHSARGRRVSDRGAMHEALLRMSTSDRTRRERNVLGLARKTHEQTILRRTPPIERPGRKRGQTKRINLPCPLCRCSLLVAVTLPSLPRAAKLMRSPPPSQSMPSLAGYDAACCL